MDAAARAFLEGEGLRAEELRPLAGDASARRYFRGRRAGGTVVVMQGESAFPQPGTDGEDPFAFARWRCFYSELGLRVPEILALDRPSGLAVLEDLGDDLLQHRLERLGVAACEEHYLLAARWARRLAEAGTARFEPDSSDSDDPLTPRRLAVEMDFFLRHALGLTAAELTAVAVGPLAEARALLHALCEDVHEAGAGVDGMVLCHRDYHARNLLVPPRSAGESPPLAIIDFQDTRRGPRAYDLASLAWDPYVSLPRELVETLVEGRRPRDVAASDWEREVALAAGQRLVKAAGSYAWLGLSCGREEYLRWFAPALSRAFDRLSAWPQASELERALREAGVAW